MGSSSSLDWSVITTAMTNYTSILGTVVDTVAKNPYLSVFLAIPLFNAGCKGFRRLIRVTR